MATDIGPKISVDGEKEYRKSLQNIVAETKALGSEMKTLESSFDDTTSSEEKMTKKSELLNKQIEAQERYVDKLEEGLKKATEQFGAGSTEAYNYQDKINKANTVLNGMKSELKNVEGGVEDTSEAMEEGDQNASHFADTLKANLLSKTITDGFEKLASAAEKVAGKFKDAIVNSANYADTFNTLATTTGLSTDTLQEYAYMADLADVSLDTVTGSLTKLTNNMQTASTGSGTMAETFKKLGVSVTDSSGNMRKAEDVFNDVITSLSEIENGTERDAIAMDVFGKSAQDLNPLMALGADGIAALKQEAHDTGYVLDSEALGSLNNVQDAMDRWNKATETLTNQIGVQFAPVLTDIIDKFTKFVQDGGLKKIVDMFEKWSPLIVGVTTAILAFKTAMEISAVIGTVTTAIQAAQAAEEGMTIAQAALNLVMNANPFVLVATLLAGVTAALVTAYMTSESFRNKVNNAFNAVKTAVTGAWNGIKSAWSSCTSFFSNIANSIRNVFNGLISSALTWGRDMIDNLVAGIKAKISAVTSAVSNIAGTIASFLHFSEPDRGPLSNFHTYMPDMMNQMASQIEEGRAKVQNAVNAVATDISMPLNGSTTMNTNNFGGTSVVIYAAEGQSADELYEVFQSRMQADFRRKSEVFA